MTLLGIDPGTRCGWALREEGGIYFSGVFDLAGGRFDGAGMRFVRLRGHLEELLKVRPFDRVAFEEVRRHLGTQAAQVYGGIVAVLMAFCEEKKIPYEGVPVAAVKRGATGRGNADKKAMLAAAAEKWPGVPFADDNEADARWVAEVAFQGVPAKKAAR